MFPFVPPLPGQAQPQGVNNPALHQAMLPSSSAAHHEFVPPSLPNFNIAGTHVVRSHGSQSGIFSRPPLMPPPMAQTGLNPALALLLQGQSVAQLLGQQGLLGLAQNPSLAAAVQHGAASWGQNLPGSLNLAVGLPTGQFCLPGMMINGNQMMPRPLGIPPLANPLAACTSSQNSGFGGNPPSQNPVQEMQTATQISRRPMSHGPMKIHQIQKNVPPSGRRQPRVHHVEDGGTKFTNVNSEDSTRKNFKRNFHGHGRFQNSQRHHVKNAKGSFRTCNRNEGRDQHNWRERKPEFMKCNNKAVVECKRRCSVIYTENEIQQWRKARRKNFPTRANVLKKLAASSRNHEDTDGDAKLRRQQLKEILAKQAELGVEVAELPPGYLSEGENQVKNERKKWNNQRDGRDPAGRYTNKYNKRGRHGRDRWQPKRQKAGDDASIRPIRKREPTLLQKLLSADIRRDKSKLLQVFRFMTLNSFFEHWPDKPLVFPLISVKETECDDEIARDKDASLDGVDAAAIGDAMVNELTGQRDPNEVEQAAVGIGSSDSESISDGEVENDMAGNKELVGELEKSEEGEITE